jgi:hypothetical protein
MPDSAVAVFADHNAAELAHGTAAEMGHARTILAAQNPTRLGLHADATSDDLLVGATP